MTSHINYLQPDDIRYIHNAILDATAGVKGALHNGLDSLCQNAEMYHEDQTLEGLAAFYLSKIAKSHSFTDGNKRTAYFATRYFLMRNGADFNGRDVKQAVDELETVAAAENGHAYEIARELTGRYVVRNQPVIEKMEQFERLVIKSIAVANLLAKS